MKPFIVALLLLLPIAALAERVIKFDPPTTRVNGERLSVGEISHFTLSCDNGAAVEIPGVSPLGEYRIDRTDVMNGWGVVECHLTTTDTDGRTSAGSNSVPLDFEAPPSAPTNLIVIQ